MTSRIVPPLSADVLSPVRPRLTSRSRSGVASDREPCHDILNFLFEFSTAGMGGPRPHGAPWRWRFGPGILAGMSPQRRQRAYDHRLVQLVQGTGDPCIATRLGVPRSTVAGWIRR